MIWRVEKADFVEELARILAKIQALKFGVFTLASGKMSSYYVDLRLIPSYPLVFKKIVNMYSRMIIEEIALSNFDIVCGVPTSGLVFASAVALSLEKPLIYTRKEVKSHGTQKTIEGILKPGDRVLLIDDLITTGTSLLAAKDDVISEGGEIKDAVVLVDRQEGGLENMMKAGVKSHNIAGITDLANALHNNNVINKEEYLSVLEQIGME
jgi:orotate phosphoribosyltransferase